MNQTHNMKDLNVCVAEAVANYWCSLATHTQEQKSAGDADQIMQSTATNCAQMDGFIDLFSETIARAGIPEHFIFRGKTAELPGFFRPTTEWDLIVVRDHRLIAAIKSKSQAGPTFGDSFNAHMDEAMARP